MHERPNNFRGKLEQTVDESGRWRVRQCGSVRVHPEPDRQTLPGAGSPTPLEHWNLENLESLSSFCFCAGRPTRLERREGLSLIRFRLVSGKSFLHSFFRFRFRQG